MYAKDAAEEAEFRAIEWKPNDKGIPGRRLPADYIMRKDPNARRAYLELRSNSRSRVSEFAVMHNSSA
jgi:hypothetical protein